METDVQRIEKLQSSEQWLIWKFQIKVLLRSHDLWEIVDGSSKMPVVKSETTAAEIEVLKKWVTSDNKAQKFIVTSIGQEPMLHIMTCESSFDMWTKLESVYEQKSKTSVHLLQQRFYSFSKSEDENLSVHISKLQKIVQQLKDLGENISETMIITKILMTLPVTYNHFYSAWESTTASEQTLKNLTARLLMEESRMNMQNDVECEALMARKGKTSSKTDSRRDSGKSKKLGKCFICKKTGHWKAECPARQREKNFIVGNVKRGDAFISQAEFDRMAEKDSWFLDSGASDHMTARREWFVSFKKFNNPVNIRVGNGEIIHAYGTGDINILAFNKVNWIEKHISNVLYVPDIKLNLFSASCALDKGLEMRSNQNECELLKKDVVVAVGLRKNKMFKLLFQVVMVGGFQVNSALEVPSCKEGQKDDLQSWHERLCHQNVDYVKKFLKLNNISYSGDTFFCSACAMGKSHRLPFVRSLNRTSLPGELVHCDLCGPMHETSYGGSRYFLLMKDDCSSFRHVYFIKQKTEVTAILKLYLEQVKIDTGYSVKTLRTDNGLEFINKDIESVLRAQGICHQKTVPYTPQQNGRAERDMRTIVEAARSMLCGKNLNVKLWAEAVNTAVYVMNRSCPSPIAGKSPYDIWFNEKSNFFDYKKFGSEVFMHVPSQKTKKWHKKAKKGLWVGYASNTKGHRILLDDTKKLEISRDVLFNESVVQSSIKESKNDFVQIKMFEDETFDDTVYTGMGQEGAGADESDVDECDVHAEADEQRASVDGVFAEEDGARGEVLDKEDEENVLMRRRIPERRRSKSSDKFQENDKEESHLIQEDYRSKLRKRKQSNFVMSEGFAFVAELFEPSNFRKAMDSPEAHRWKCAMDEEIASLLKNNTWHLVNLPKGRKIIGNRWVYKVKLSADGRVSRYKARLVIKGYSQEYGLDYSETFSPVVKFSSIRTILAIAAAEDLKLFQFDIKTAFLNGDLSEDIFMRQPEGYDDGSGKVCKLQKSLYGLKQSSRCWNKKFSAFLQRFDFKVSLYDPCVFINISKKRKVLLAIYIDDGLVAASSKEDADNLLKCLQQEFEVTHSDANYFLGMEISRRQDGAVIIHQAAYARRLLKKFHMNDSKPVSTPSVKTPNAVTRGNYAGHFPFREAVGSLMYLAVGTRPDISFAISSVSRHLENPNETNICAVKRIFKYINGTMDHGIVYNINNKMYLHCFSDADYAGDVETRRSTSGAVIMLCGGAVSWQSQRQKCVSLSTTESEYIAAAEAVKDLVWLQKLFCELTEAARTCSTLYLDNQSAIKLIKNPEFHKRTKHIDVRYHFIRENYEDDMFKIEYVPSEQQVADLFTKSLPKEQFYKLKSSLNLHSSSNFHK